MIERIRRYVRYRFWAAQQFPDPELIFRHGGIGDVVRYLAGCGGPQVVKEILTRFGANIHPNAHPIGPRITLHEVGDDFGNLTVGPSAHVGCEAFLDLSDRIVIEESVTIGMRSIVLTHMNLGEGYPNKPVARIFKAGTAPVTIKRGSSIGAGAVILKGVTIGEDSIIGAGVVVTRSVPARTVVHSSRQRKDYEIPDEWFHRVARQENGDTD